VQTIDLRSDTVTRPTDAMRAAIARAEVGDDVYGEDPTINALQERAAELLGKEAALLVPSGTMGNQASIRALTQPGDVVLAGENAHVLLYESGAPAALSGVQVQTLGEGGLFTGDDVRNAILPGDSHYAVTRLVSVENTHNRGGGRVFPLEQLREVARAARENDLRLHLDGARIFNAVVATGIPAARWAEPFDTVTFCLSKGLGAPVGSLICSTKDRTRDLHRARKMLGGGMRQAGLLAAAGLYALEHHIDRLTDDHANAKRLASGLEELGYRIAHPPETNMVMFHVEDAKRFLSATCTRSLLINPMGPGLFRAVTHLDVPEPLIDEALSRLEDAHEKGDI
jgi:threonine aldolase